jgi:maltooligosyltrehalose trehalohydrolase
MSPRCEPRSEKSCGAFPGTGGTLFRTFTSADAASVVLYDAHGDELATHTLHPAGDGLFEAWLPRVDVGARYKFLLNGRALPDPYARFLPDGVDGAAVVTDPTYPWEHEGVAIPLDEQVIYELHVGTFTLEGTYAGAATRLRDLRDLGVTTIELMPIAAFAGQHGWGYDAVASFAPHAPYGTPHELRRFIDQAHGLGLSVVLDVVYNHFGPAGNHLPAYSADYLLRDKAGAWGEAPNFALPSMRRLVLDSALQWLFDYRFDGLRLDATHAIVDSSPAHILRELATVVSEIHPKKLLFAEDDRNDPATLHANGLHALWADDFHHQLRVTLTAERDGYYAAYEGGAAALADVINRGWSYEGQVYPPTGKPRGKPASGLPPQTLIYCIQNHDQVGNRAFGDRLTEGISRAAYEAASMLLLFLPATPLLFMGQEWGASTPFPYFTDHAASLGEAISKGRREEFAKFRAFSDPASRDAIPDPQARSTFERARLRWEERSEPDKERTWGLYRRLLALRRNDVVLGSSRGPRAQAIARGEVLEVRRSARGQSRCLFVNLGTEPRLLTELTDQPFEPLLKTTNVTPAGVLPSHSAVIVAQHS